MEDDTLTWKRKITGQRDSSHHCSVHLLSSLRNEDYVLIMLIRDCVTREAASLWCCSLILFSFKYSIQIVFMSQSTHSMLISIRQWFCSFIMAHFSKECSCSMYWSEIRRFLDLHNDHYQCSIRLCSFYFKAYVSDSSIDSRSYEKRMIITAFAAIGTSILFNNLVHWVENR